jgi:hypothetical protein
LYSGTKSKTVVSLPSGRPVSIVLTADRPAPPAKEGRVMMRVLRLTATKLDEDAESLRREERRLNSLDQTMISTMVLEFMPHEDGLSVERLERLLASEADAKRSLLNLEELGDWEVLSRPSLLVEWPQEATIRIGEEAPVPAHSEASENDNEAQVDDEIDTGLMLNIYGYWTDETDPNRAMISVVWNMSRPARTEAEREISPVVTDRFHRKLAIWQGQPAWLVFKQSSDSKPESFWILRLAADRLRTPGE